jgi:hypothetical protein
MVSPVLISTTSGGNANTRREADSGMRREGLWSYVEPEAIHPNDLAAREVGSSCAILSSV